MQVGMQIITHITIFLDYIECFLVDNKLLLETASARGLVIRIGDIAYGNTLATVLGSNPVGIWQVNTYCRCRILIATKHSSTDNIG